jgi:hypothetical protein
MPLHPDIQALRAHVETMRPNPCCVAKPMRETTGKVTMCCDDACPWSKLEMLIAVVSIAIPDPEPVYEVGDFLLPTMKFPDDHYRIDAIQEREPVDGTDQTDIIISALHTESGHTMRRSLITEKFKIVMCKNCGKNKAKVLHGRTLTPQQIAENQAWSDSLKVEFHTGHCPHLELPQQHYCQSCHEANPIP